MSNQLAEFYYALEQALEDRPLYCEGLEQLEFLRLDEKTQDPYLQALYYKHGIFGSVELQKAFDLFINIYDKEINYDEWRNMKPSIGAFVTNQLSLFHLGYNNITQINHELSDKYLQESIDLGNRMAIETKASDMFMSYRPENDDDNQSELNNIIFMFEKAKILGSKTVFVELIECYKLTKKYTMMFEAYEHLLVKHNNTIYFDQLSRDYLEAKKNGSSKNSLLYILIECQDSPELRNCMKKHIDLFDEEIIEYAIAEHPSDNALQNLLFIFNNSVLLYKKYMKKLFAYFRIVQSIQNSIVHECADLHN